MKSLTIQLETLSCPSCVQKIENALKRTDGIDKDSIKILFNSSKIKLNFDDKKVTLEEIENSITKLGYEILKSKTN